MYGALLILVMLFAPKGLPGSGNICGEGIAVLRAEVARTEDAA